LAVKINGNRGVHQEISVSTKFSKETVSFQQEFPILEGDIKNEPIGHPESDKKLRLPVLLGIRLHPKTSDSATLLYWHRLVLAFTRQTHLLAFLFSVFLRFAGSS